MRFGVTANPQSTRAVEATRKVIQTLEKEHRVRVEENLAKILGMEGAPLDAMGIDYLVTVGGDGTILRALQQGDFEILGVNISRVGFLTEIGLDQVDMALQRLAEGDYVIDERIKLRVEVEGTDLPECTNEAVVHTSNVAKIRRFLVRVDGESAAQVESDGIIVATPTGSTAYALSAGGPILDPRLRAFSITALAPFRQTLRPTVVPAESAIEVELQGRGPCLLVLDGQSEVDLAGEEVLTLGLADQKARFVRFRRTFYRRIQEKLVEGLAP